MELNKIHKIDWIEGLNLLEDNSIDFCMTSPPYWGLRDYGVDGQLGLESHPKEYINKLMQGFDILKEKLKKSGSFYLNLGDTYCSKASQGFGGISESTSYHNREKPHGRKRELTYDGKWLQPKQLMMMPSRIAIAMQERGWILRNDIIWAKPNPMPSSVKDRLNTTFEHIFHFVKSRKYYYDLDAIREAHSEVSENRYKQEAPLSATRLTKTNDVNARQIYGNPDMQPNLLGKNPGDVYRQEFRENWKNITMPNMSQFNNTLGKNPGDVLEIPSETRPKWKGSTIRGIEPSKLHPTKDIRWNHPLGKNPSDIMRITTKPFPEAHFAVYPIEICEKPIKSSVPSEICSKCGFIREKIIETTFIHRGDKGHARRGLEEEQKGNRKIGIISREKIGWNKYNTKGYTKCSCNAKYRGAVCLDIFAGAGSTFVALKKFKPTAKWIGFELNEEYIKIANKRLAQKNLYEIGYF